MDIQSLRFDGHTRVLGTLPRTEVSLERPRVDLPDGTTVDEFGVIRRGDAPLNAPIPSMEALSAYRFPAPQEEFLRERMETLERAQEGTLRVCSLREPLFGRAESLAGADTLRRAIREDPAFVHELLRRVTEQSLACLEAALQYPVDAVHLCELRNPAPADWRVFVRPYLARLYAMIRAYGHPVIGTCSRALLPELEALGLDVLLECG